MKGGGNPLWLLRERRAPWAIGGDAGGLADVHAGRQVCAYFDNYTNKRFIISGDSKYGNGCSEAEYNRQSPGECCVGLTYRF